jgi:hypothetical protein
MDKSLSVTAVTQQDKPSVYPKVDDEATIILKYPNMSSSNSGFLELAIWRKRYRSLWYIRYRYC